MRVLARVFFTALAFASMVLLAGTAALWVRSYWVVEDFHRLDAAAPPDIVDDDQLQFVAPTAASVDCRCHLRFGGVGIIVSRLLTGGLYGEGEPRMPDGWRRTTLRANDPQAIAYQPVCPTRLGLGCEHLLRRPEDTHLADILESLGHSPCRLAGFPPTWESWRVEIRCWLAAALFSVLPLAWVAWAWRPWRRRRKPGCCRRCGYDLRGSHDRCPECGTPAPGPPAPEATPAPST